MAEGSWSRVHGLIAATVATLLAACATDDRSAIETLKREHAPPGVLVMPLDVELYEVSAGGIRERRADWTEDAKNHLMDALHQQAERRRLELIAFDETGLSPDVAEQAIALRSLHRAVGRSILHYEYGGGPRLPTKPDDTLDWSLGPAVRTLAEAHNGADYALFVHLRDSYSSPGRVLFSVAVAVLFRSVAPGGSQTGFASLIDLDSGDVVWFNVLGRPGGDVRDAESAADTASILLRGLPE